MSPNMSILGWCAKRLGGLAMVALSVLCYWVISREAAASRHSNTVPSRDTASVAPPPPSGAGNWTVLFSWYCLLIHALVLAFPLRACWAIWDITTAMRKASRTKALLSPHRHDSSTFRSSFEALAGSLTGSHPNSDVGDRESDVDSDTTEVPPDSIVHAIVIPNYKEEVDTLRETLEVLASHPQARNSYDIYLAMEQREKNAEVKAVSLIAEFAEKFRAIDFTLHPCDLPDECAGKGSNVDWAARKLSERYHICCRKKVIVTGIDADSHLSPTYFELVTSMHWAYPETASTTMYSPPIIFDRNADSVPAIVRVADILWCAAGLSGHYTGSTIAPPTSVYSLPLQLVDRVGGWDRDSEAIGEDLHMYLKCFFALNGNLTVRTVVSPVSQSNVTAGGHGKGMTGLVSDMRARYEQALRHMWGALDTGFALRKLVQLWRNRKQASRAFRPLHSSPRGSAEMHVSDTHLEAAVGSPMSGPPDEVGFLNDVTHGNLREPNYQRLLAVFHRLFEAHFLPVQMTILIIASALYMWVTKDADDIHGVAWVFDICKYLRTLGFIKIGFYLFLYENFHEVAVTIREKEMNDAGLDKGMNFAHRTLRQNLVDYVMVPLVAPLYGAIPCAQAQICHFWTVDLVYIVSKKATRKWAKSPPAEALP